MIKKSKIVGVMLLASVAFISCKKNKCAECHYDKDGQEVELGNYCGDDIEDIEASGHNEDGVNYTVHCGEH